MTASARFAVMAVIFALFSIARQVGGHSGSANLWSVLSALALFLMAFVAITEGRRR